MTALSAIAVFIIIQILLFKHHQHQDNPKVEFAVKWDKEKGQEPHKPTKGEEVAAAKGEEEDYVEMHSEKLCEDNIYMEIETGKVEEDEDEDYMEIEDKKESNFPFKENKPSYSIHTVVCK